jgi:hypothetical protein
MTKEPGKPKNFTSGEQLGNYLVGPLIRSGSVGNIYFAHSKFDINFKIALKCECKSAKQQFLKKEVNFFCSLNECPYFSIFYGSKKTGEVNYFAMELLDPSLNKMLKILKKKKFFFTTEIRIEIKML